MFWASQLKCLLQTTGRQGPLILSQCQIEVLKALAVHDRIIILKARQQYISTICCLYDLLYAWSHPGHSVAIVADRLDKAEMLLAKCTEWALQLGLPVSKADKRTLKLKLISKETGLQVESTIYAMSCGSRAEDGESGTGRGYTLGLIHCSELAFWYNDDATMQSLTSGCLPGCKVVIESTASPADNYFQQTWNKTGNGWHKIFFSVEEHEAYRLDEVAITDSEWKRLQKLYKFSRRDSAAWWLRKMKADLNGNKYRALREYPVKWEQAFIYAEGKWIFSHKVAKTVKDGHWSYYRDPLPGEKIVFGIDTAGGHEGDYSVIVVMGQQSGQIIATWKDNKQPVPQFAEIIKAAEIKYKPVAMAIESNGIGGALADMVNQFSNKVHRYNADRSEKEIRYSKMREAIETGQIEIGPEIAAETKSSIVSQDGTYSGIDDALSALSFALKWLEYNPYKAPKEVFNPQIFVPPINYTRSSKRRR